MQFVTYALIEGPQLAPSLFWDLNAQSIDLIDGKGESQTLTITSIRPLSCTHQSKSYLHNQHLTCSAVTCYSYCQTFIQLLSLQLKQTIMCAAINILPMVVGHASTEVCKALRLVHEFEWEIRTSSVTLLTVHWQHSISRPSSVGRNEIGRASCRERV